MSGKTEPALTAEILVPEVVRYLVLDDPDWRMFNWDRLIRQWGPHAGAALLLHGQPFGFTWEDVDMVRVWASELEAMYDSIDELSAYDNWQRWKSLADRIAALLPPREDYPLDRGDA